MNFHKRDEIIKGYNEGNHVNGDAPDRSAYEELEDECPECGTFGQKSYIKRNGICEACFQEQFKNGR